MRFSVIISSFFLFVTVRQIRSHKENEINANFDVNKFSDQIAKSENAGNVEMDFPEIGINTGIEVRSYLPPWEVAQAYAHVESLKAQAFEIRNRARWQFDTAMGLATLVDDQTQDEVSKILEDIKKEQYKDKEINDQNYKKELRIAENLKRLANSDRGKRKEYENALKRAETKRREINDNIMKKYEKKRAMVNAILMKAESDFKEALDRASQEFEAAVKEAERIEAYIGRILYSIHG